MSISYLPNRDIIDTLRELDNGHDEPARLHRFQNEEFDSVEVSKIVSNGRMSAPLHEEEKERHQDSKSHSHREDPKARLEVNTFGQNILRKIDNEKNIINKNGRPELLILKSLTPDPIKTKKKKIFEPNVC